MVNLEHKMCNICGKEGADTFDLILPQMIYRRTSNREISVPVHTRCHHSYLEDDHHFTLFTLLISYWTSEHSQELWDTKVKRTLNWNEAVKFNHFLKISMQAENRFMTESLLKALHFDTSRLEHTLTRVVKGLYYDRKGVPYKGQLHFETKYAEYHNEDLLVYEILGDGVLKFLWKEDEVDHAAFISMVFFDSIEFSCTI